MPRDTSVADGGPDNASYICEQQNLSPLGNITQSDHSQWVPQWEGRGGGVEVTPEMRLLVQTHSDVCRLAADELADLHQELLQRLLHF